MVRALVTLLSMGVTGISPPSREGILHQVEKVVNSDLLKGSESLCRLLRFLADHALDSPGTPIKEYQIATEVFGRSTEFDPRLDSTVRVQTGRLRSKLSEYYSGPGAEDRILIELPKGSYSVTINERLEPERPTSPISSSPALQPVVVERVTLRPTALIVSVWVLGVATLVLLVALATVLLHPPSSRPQEPALGKASPAFRTFWHGFIEGPEKPWVVFSNAAFVGRPETGMRYYDSSRDLNTPILDHYTGVGEVLAIHELDQLFSLLDHSIRVKRGRLLSLDDAKNNDIIFIGSPTENLSLRDMPGTQEFVFRLSASGRRKGDLEIVNLKPRQGEAVSFRGSPTVPISEDYALIGLLPGMNSSHLLMILAGTTTIGTQAAVEFVTRVKNVEELIGRVGIKDGEIRPFEAVIKVKVTGGVPVSSELAALHPRN